MAQKHGRPPKPSRRESMTVARGFCGRHLVWLELVGPPNTDGGLRRHTARDICDKNSMFPIFSPLHKEHRTVSACQRLDLHQERFYQTDFRRYVVLQRIFLKVIKDQPWENELREVCPLYSGDIDKYRLEGQLPLLLPTAFALEFE